MSDRGGGVRGGGGAQGGYEQRIEVFVKIQKKILGGGQGEARSGGCWGGQGRCNREVKFL